MLEGRCAPPRASRMLALLLLLLVMHRTRATLGPQGAKAVPSQEPEGRDKRLFLTGLEVNEEEDFRGVEKSPGLDALAQTPLSNPCIASHWESTAIRVGRSPRRPRIAFSARYPIQEIPNTPSVEVSVVISKVLRTTRQVPVYVPAAEARGKIDLLQAEPALGPRRAFRDDRSHGKAARELCLAPVHHGPRESRARE